MGQKIIYGKFEYKDKEYPFFLEGQVITVVRAPLEFRFDFENVRHIDCIKGVTSRNQYIFFLDCNSSGIPLITAVGDLQFTCKGYICSNSPTGNYDCIHFSSPALNAFFSPRRAIDYTFDDSEKITFPRLTLKNPNDSVRKFTSIIEKEQVECALEFYSSITLKAEDSSIGTVKALFSMSFAETKSVSEVGKYYLYFYDFLVFLNFRADVPIDDAILFEQDETGKRHKIGIMKIFQRDCSQYAPDINHSILYDDLSDETLSKVFALIAERRTGINYNPFFVPEDGREARYLNSAKWLISAISFEGEFDKRFSDFKYEQDERFHTAKDVLLKAIDDAVVDSDRSINNKVNAAYRSFRRLITNADTTIKEKFQLCMNRYADEVASLVEKYVRIEGVDPSTDFAQVYSDYRNMTAHGSIRQVSAEEIVVFQLLNCFIYLLILEEGEVPKEKRKEIVYRMF